MNEQEKEDDNLIDKPHVWTSEMLFAWEKAIQIDSVLPTLPKEERLEVFRGVTWKYCIRCGGNPLPCSCGQNDRI